MVKMCYQYSPLSNLSEVNRNRAHQIFVTLSVNTLSKSMVKIFHYSLQNNFSHNDKNNKIFIKYFFVLDRKSDLSEERKKKILVFVQLI